MIHAFKKQIWAITKDESKQTKRSSCLTKIHFHGILIHLETLLHGVLLLKGEENRENTNQNLIAALCESFVPGFFSEYFSDLCSSSL